MRVLFERNDSDLIESGQIRAVLDALPVAVSFGSVADERIHHFNKAFTRTFGYPDRSFGTIRQWLSHAYASEGERASIELSRAPVWNGRRDGISDIGLIECTIRCADNVRKAALVRETVVWSTGIGFATFEDVSDRRDVEIAMRRAMLQDPLTGLWNRRGLDESWAAGVQARRDASAPTVVLMLDLDGFKPVNDRLGHDAGDTVLQAVARRIRAAVRDCDVVARMGGDEFVVVLSGVATPRRAEAVCDRIVGLLKKPFWSRHGAVEIGVSIGMSLCPRDGYDLRSLLHAADMALYCRKREHVGGWAWFEPT